MSRLANAADMYRASSATALSDPASSWGLGVATSFFAAYALRDGFQVHIGIENRLDLASQQGEQLMLEIPYPSVRVQTGLFYVGLGLAPFVFRHASPTAPANAAAGSLQRSVESSFAYFGEVGLLWAITPKFSLTLSATEAFVRGDYGTGAGTVTSPGPILSFAGGMRFNFGFSAPSEASSGEFEGWRYPYGQIR